MHIKDTANVRRCDVIDLLGISEAQFQRLKKAGVFSANPGHAYDLKSVIKAWAQYHADGHSPGNTAEEKRKLTIAQRQRIELDMRQRRGELVPLADAQAAFTQAMVLVAGQLDALPGRVAGELAGLSDPALVRASLFDETRRIRDAAAHVLEDFATDSAGGGGDGTTATEDG